VAAAILALLFLPNSGYAEDYLFSKKGPLDPSQAYIIYSVDRSGAVLNFVKVPTEDDVREYEAAKDAAFQLALAKYDKKFASRTSSAGPGSLPPRPDRQSFAFQPIEQFLSVQVDYSEWFAAGDGPKKVYGHKVKPGTYAIYGPIMTSDIWGTWGTCLCLGTVKFEVKAGEAVDLGLVESFDGIHPTKTSEKYIRGTGLDLPEGKTTFVLTPGTSFATGQSRLIGLTVRPARFHAAGQYPNWYGLNVDRITAIPGVIAYDRDKMIDLTSAEH
jgi:hypothetical protein